MKNYHPHDLADGDRLSVEFLYLCCRISISGIGGLIFLLVNIILIPFVNMGLFYFNPDRPCRFTCAIVITYVTIYLMLNVMFVACALGLRYMMRWAEMQRQLEEQNRKIPRRNSTG